MSLRHASEEDVDGNTTAIPDVPDAPASASSADVGTSRAYNNGAATVTFSAAATGGAPTSYTATTTPGSFTATGASSPLTVTGLQSATSYSIAVTSTNSTGTSGTSTSAGSITATSVPATPSAPTATDAGSGRAYNNGAASVAFTAPASGGKSISSYTVTSSPGSFTTSGASSPLTLTGLQSATSYTYSVTATNANGTSTASSSSSAVTATTAPQAPTIGTATPGAAGSGQVSITFTAGATGGSTITGYTVTSSPGNIIGTGSSSPITVSGLTIGTSYTFTATATNANGTSAASSASNSVTPAGYSLTGYYGGNGVFPMSGMTVDSNGNFYATFFSYDSSFNQAGTIAKMSSSGANVWKKTESSGYNPEYINASAPSASGNVYITGTIGTSPNSAHITKLNSNGVTVWSRKFSQATYATTGQAIAIDSSENVYVAGNYGTGTGTAAWIAKYDTNGNIQWQRKLTNTNQQISSTSLALDSSNNVYLAGGNSNSILAKYNSSGTFQWCKATYGDAFQGVAVDSNNYVYVTGSQQTYGISTLHKLDSNGTQQWKTALRGNNPNSNNFDCGYGVGVDLNGNVYMGGTTDLTGSQVGYVSKFNSSGALQFQRTINPTNSKIGFTVDSSGTMYFGGYYNGAQIYIWHLPSDGSKTGTYNFTGETAETYAAFSATVRNTDANDFQALTVTDSAGSFTDASASYTTVDSTLTTAYQAL